MAALGASADEMSEMSEMSSDLEEEAEEAVPAEAAQDARAQVPKAPPPAPPRPERDQRKALQKWVSSMRVVRPELVRSIFAYQALWGAGSALRIGGPQKLRRLHGMSRATESIQEFWSHSWQLGPYRKIVCLLFLKNGLAASLLGTLAALVAFGLAFYQRLTEDTAGGGIGSVSLACTLSGTVVWVMTLLLWRSPVRVFLDVCCIDQVDGRNKAEGIVSLGGILRSSQSLLILWDRTWIERLWCVFEMAAFLHRSGNPSVAICSTHLGPAALAAYAAVPVMGVLSAALHGYGLEEYSSFVLLLAFFASFYAGTSSFRRYHYSLEVFHKQLTDFRVANAECKCCSIGHRAPDGTALPCDREVIERCIVDWFGSVEQFEAFTAPLLRSIFDKQLGQHSFPYHYFLLVFTPVLWSGMDFSVASYGANRHHDHWPVFFLFQFLGFWLGVMPATAKLGLYLSSYFCRPRRYMLCDLLLNLLIVTVLNCCFFASLVLAEQFNSKPPRWMDAYTRDYRLRAFLLCVTYCLPAAALWWVPELIRQVRARCRKPAADVAHAV